MQKKTPQQNTKNLFILAFDQRSSFLKMFGIGAAPTAEDLQSAASAKTIIYQGFRRALDAGVPSEQAAILVDEQFGSEVLRSARRDGVRFLLPVEQSGIEEFDFEHGDDFGKKIEFWNPSFVKALVRYNPEGDSAANMRSRERLVKLSRYCSERDRDLLLELLVPATDGQLFDCAGDVDVYDAKMRPALMVRAIDELRLAGISPKIWKVEGLEKTAEYERIVAAIRTGGAASSGLVILGRAAEQARLERWLDAGRSVEGVIGFAIGRSIFAEPISRMHAGTLDAEGAVAEIAGRYVDYYRFFTRTETA